MAVMTVCWRCGRPAVAADQLAGSLVRCGPCGASFPIPATGGEICSSCGKDISFETHQRDPSTGDSRFCPRCFGSRRRRVYQGQSPGSLVVCTSCRRSLPIRELAGEWTCQACEQERRSKAEPAPLPAPAAPQPVPQPAAAASPVPLPPSHRAAPSATAASPARSAPAAAAVLATIPPPPLPKRPATPMDAVSQTSPQAPVAAGERTRVLGTARAAVLWISGRRSPTMTSKPSPAPSSDPPPAPLSQGSPPKPVSWVWVSLVASLALLVTVGLVVHLLPPPAEPVQTADTSPVAPATPASPAPEPAPQPVPAPAPAPVAAPAPAPAPQASAIQFLQPTDGQVVPAGTDLQVQVEATDPAEAAKIARLKFYLDDTLIGDEESPPYTETIKAIQPGSHALRIDALDAAGAVIASTQVRITVPAN